MNAERRVPTTAQHMFRQINAHHNGKKRRQLMETESGSFFESWLSIHPRILLLQLDGKKPWNCRAVLSRRLALPPCQSKVVNRQIVLGALLNA
jgi:hypothetical protein